MNSTALVSLAGALARAGLPALATILGAIMPPPFNLVVAPAFALIRGALGLPDTATPADVQAHVDADPAAAQAKLHDIDAAHAEAATELQATLADVASARSTEVALAQAGSPIQWGASVVSIVATAGFVAAAILVLLHQGEPSAAANQVLGAMIVGWTTVLTYWLGASKGGSDRAQQMATMLHQAIGSGARTRGRS